MATADNVIISVQNLCKYFKKDAIRALDGISRRFKNKKGPPRPSFIDTGTYQAAMRAWVSGVLNAFPG